MRALHAGLGRIEAVAAGVLLVAMVLLIFGGGIARLMAMPLPKQDGLSHSADWDAVVARRMETKLASALRSLLEEEPTRKRA